MKTRVFYKSNNKHIFSTIKYLQPNNIKQSTTELELIISLSYINASIPLCYL